MQPDAVLFLRLLYAMKNWLCAKQVGKNYKVNLSFAGEIKEGATAVKLIKVKEFYFLKSRAKLLMSPQGDEKSLLYIWIKHTVTQTVIALTLVQKYIMLNWIL